MANSPQAHARGERRVARPFADGSLLNALERSRTYPMVNVSTVYRNVTVMSECGVLHSIEHGGETLFGLAALGQGQSVTRLQLCDVHEGQDRHAQPDEHLQLVAVAGELGDDLGDASCPLVPAAAWPCAP